MVLRVLKENHFVVNQSKCSFGRNKLEYLGHVLSKDAVAVDPKKVSSVLEWAIPHNVNGIRGFLGLTGYYRKFIQGYGKIAKPLNELTKKDAFKWV